MTKKEKTGGGMKLLHKLLPERVNREALASIAHRGLLPQLPSEYKKSLPNRLRETPIVWLSESMNTRDGMIYSVDADRLDSEKLHKLDWGSVNWWVYEGIIPPELIEPLIGG